MARSNLVASSDADPDHQHKDPDHHEPDAGDDQAQNRIMPGADVQGTREHEGDEKAETVRVQRTADEDPLLESARRVLDWMARERMKTITSRVVQQSCPRPRPKTAANTEKVWDLLEDHGYLRARPSAG